MTFTENETTGRPALALICIRTRPARIDTNGEHYKYKAGDIRAVRLIAQDDAAGYNNARRELLAIVKQGGSEWTKNWRIAEGVA